MGAVETVIETRRRPAEVGHEPRTAARAAVMLAGIAKTLTAAVAATKG